MSKEIQLPEHELCTGCGVCGEICPTHSIRFETDQYGCAYPVIDVESCVQCGACMKHCHILKEKEKKLPQKVYAAWNSIDKERATSASGGIASAIYHYALEHEISVYGVQYRMHDKAVYVPIRSKEDIAACKNSKYVSSECIGVFPDIKQRLKDGKKVIFIGLPCHAAALNAYLRKKYENLLVVDIVCHGVASPDYLNQHICAIEHKKNRIADRMYFRDPACGTHNFMMTLHDHDGCFYRAGARGRDLYQTGYHTALIYRENCYHCQYASPERVSDITISDFSGLGRLSPWEGSKSSVSCVLVTTDMGKQFVETLQQESRIVCNERPLGEALQYEVQLQHPSVPHRNRHIFKEVYAKTQNFEEAARILKTDGDVAYYLRLAFFRKIRAAVAMLLPEKLKKLRRRIIQKYCNK